MRVFSLLVLGLLISCATAPSSVEDRKILDVECEAMVAKFKRQDPRVDIFFQNSAAYAILPDIGKGGMGFGGAYGRGQVYKGGEMIGFCDMSQGSVGFQLGGQSFAELIFFQTEEALRRFQSNNFEFAAGASAVAAESGSGTAADYADGTAVFVMVKGGLMFDASIGGQSFTYQAK